MNLASHYTEYAGFANVDYHFTDQFDLSVGGRYSHNDQHESSELTGGPLAGPASPTVGGSSSENVFTFAIAPKFVLNADTTLYGRISKGYRPGGPNALNPLAPAAVPRTFASDSIVNYEVGIKGDAAGGAVNYDLTAFYIDWSRIQLLADIQNFAVNTNGGSASSTGIEGSIAWAATAELTLSANGAYTDAHLTEDTGPLVGGHNGDRLPYSSPVGGSLSADYRHELSSDTHVFLGASVDFTGRRRTDFNTTDDGPGPRCLAYTTVDLCAAVSISASTASRSM